MSLAKEKADLDLDSCDLVLVMAATFWVGGGPKKKKKGTDVGRTSSKMSERK